MNLNLFFTVIFAGLLSIYIFFKPLNLKEQSFVDVPLFELQYFTLYEVNPSGLVVLMSGDEATKYRNRYSVSNINFTDNSKEQMINIKADYGTYEDNMINVMGDIEFFSENGLMFKTQEASYDKKNNLITTKSQYFLSKNESTMKGSALKYYNILDKIESSHVEIKYQLQENGK